MLYPPSAVERAMQIKDVMLRAMNKEYSWLRAAEILGITPRGLRRIRQRMEQFGYEGLVDTRHGRPSPRRTRVEEIERILELYREKYPGFNVRHFHQTVRREHGVKVSYSCVKQILQGAGLVKKRRSRGRHRMKRPRRACFGEMLHMDGSRHAWLTLVPEERQTLIQVIDDATSRLLYAQLWRGETSQAVMTALREVIEEHGIPQSLYTDRASWAFETRGTGGKVDKAHLTQFGEALARLGIEHIPSYSPQARGRSERMNRTLQDRLVNELRVAGIRTLEAANVYLRERYLPTHNEHFARPAAESTDAFADRGGVDLDGVFFEEVVRKVGKDNTVSVDGIRFQIGKQTGRRTCAGLAVQVRRHLDGRYTVNRGTQLFGVYEADGRPRLVEAQAPTRKQAPGATKPGRIDPRLVPVISTHGDSARRARARVPASARLRLPPAGTRQPRAATKI